MIFFLNLTFMPSHLFHPVSRTTRKWLLPCQNLTNRPTLVCRRTLSAQPSASSVHMWSPSCASCSVRTWRPVASTRRCGPPSWVQSSTCGRSWTRWVLKGWYPGECWNADDLVMWPDRLWKKMNQMSVQRLISRWVLKGWYPGECWKADIQVSVETLMTW